MVTAAAYHAGRGSEARAEVVLYCSFTQWTSTCATRSPVQVRQETSKHQPSRLCRTAPLSRRAAKAILLTMLRNDGARPRERDADARKTRAPPLQH